ncbi:hypothetical protein ACQXY9_07325, partial [Corynebacterium diphtheriae]
RVCGEDYDAGEEPAWEMEIPPRVRRRLIFYEGGWHRSGNTSACAEKTVADISKWGAWWKYLRVCGEDSPSTGNESRLREIPPRVRRRH